MSTTRLTSLKRRQIDDLIRPLAELPQVPTPRVGWIRSVRTALGMTMEQLGKRLGRTSKQAIEQLEKSEANGSLSLHNLRSAADALDCEVIIAFRPKHGSIETTVRHLAMRKAREMDSQVRHTMALEAQADGLDEHPDLHAEAQWWLNQNAARLWD